MSVVRNSGSGQQRSAPWGCRREVLWGSQLSDRGTGALTKRLPKDVIEVRLKAGGMLLCGTGTRGNRLYFDCPPVQAASTGGGRDRMCRRSELCRLICVSVGRWASAGGSGRGGGIRGWEDDSTGGRDSGLRASGINAACYSLRDRKWDRHIRSPYCHVMRGLRIGFRSAKRNRARNPQMYCTNPRASSPVLSLSNTMVFGVNGSLREASGGDGGAGP